MLMYNLIEYSNNYSDTSGSLWQFKRDEIEGDVDLTVDGNHIPNNSSSFKYKSVLLQTKICKKSCSTKIAEQFLDVVRNAID